MLFARPTQKVATVLASDATLPGDAVWLDLLNPTEEERAQAERLTGLHVPTRADLSEIESTSRVSRRDDVLIMSTPLTRRREGDCRSTPLGIVVAPHLLLTIRFDEYPAFETYARAVEGAKGALTANELLLGLLEAIVDRLADVLEYTGADLDRVSAEVFHPTPGKGRRDADIRLRRVLREVGRTGDVLSLLRDSLLGLNRILLFIDEAVRESADAHARNRVANLLRDVRSLSDFDNQVTTKVQFLLDATLGFINIDQNNGIRVLTVVSLIGIPPTLIASIYGMNFKNIPELNWSFGYYYALVLMAASVILPLIWFRRVRWI